MFYFIFTRKVTLSVISSRESSRGFSKMLIMKNISSVVHFIIIGYFSEMIVIKGVAL